MCKAKNQVVSGVLIALVAFSLSFHECKAAELVRVDEDIIEDGGISVCALYANAFSTMLSVSGSTAKISASVYGVSGVTKIHAKIVLQKYSDSKWSAVKTYENTVKSSNYTFSKTKAVSKGKYRVKAVYTVYKGAKSEKVTKYSNTVTCS